MRELDELQGQLLHIINGTFILELLAQLLEIREADITEQCFAGVDAGSQNGKILILVSHIDTVPVYRQVSQEIFENGLCIAGIALEQFREEFRIEAFIENKHGRDIWHGAAIFLLAIRLNIICTMYMYPKEGTGLYPYGNNHRFIV